MGRAGEYGRAGRHLCQPGGGASCGGCCGLYNVPDRSRGALTARLERQTTRLAAVEKSGEAFAEAARALAREVPPALFAEVRVCPLLGFVDEARTRVGCLAHPAVTGGPDLREAGVWDAALCAGHQCPSFAWLTGEEADLVRDACADWYLYGRVVTDVPLVRAVLELLAREVGGRVSPARLRARPPALAILREIFEAVEDGARDPGGWGGFRVGADGSVEARPAPGPAWGMAPAPEDEVVLHLGTPLAGPEDLEAGRRWIRDRIRSLAGAVAPSPA